MPEKFQPVGGISGRGSSDLKATAKKGDENILRKMQDRRNLLQEELRNLHYTNANREVDVAMKRNQIVKLESRLKFTQQEVIDIIMLKVV
jgi:hypothetical protein